MEQPAAPWLARRERTSAVGGHHPLAPLAPRTPPSARRCGFRSPPRLGGRTPRFPLRAPLGATGPTFKAALGARDTNDTLGQRPRPRVKRSPSLPTNPPKAALAKPHHPLRHGSRKRKRPHRARIIEAGQAPPLEPRPPSPPKRRTRRRYGSYLVVSAEQAFVSSGRPTAY